MKFQEQEENLQEGAFIDSPLEENGETMFEDAPKGADVQAQQNESPLMLPLRLFCYGVRYHHPTAEGIV